MAGLEVELDPALLSDYTQIGPQRGLGNRLGRSFVPLERDSG
jgi:hypothetical protein